MILWSKGIRSTEAKSQEIPDGLHTLLCDMLLASVISRAVRKSAIEATLKSTLMQVGQLGA